MSEIAREVTGRVCKCGHDSARHQGYRGKCHESRCVCWGFSADEDVILTPAQQAEIDLSAATVQPLSPQVQLIDALIENLEKLRQMDPPLDEEEGMILGLRLLSAERDVKAAIELCCEAGRRVADEATKRQ